jgi:hypothetical protein
MQRRGNIWTVVNATLLPGVKINKRMIKKLLLFIKIPALQKQINLEKMKQKKGHQ